MPSTEAERLKNEGNALYIENDFNASSLGLNKYLEAGADAAKATKLDPRYAKAWARLAAARTGLHRPDLAVEAWKHALSALPTENSTPAQQRQRDQYKQELDTAEAKLATPLDSVGIVVIPAAAGKVPRDRAAALLPALAAHRLWDSSAWVIDYADSQWQAAYRNMKLGRTAQMPMGGMGYFGHTGVIEGFSNAILTDTRVFHIAENNFIQMYDTQSEPSTAPNIARRSEAGADYHRVGHWADGGYSRVMEELPGRLAAEGWDSVRPALSLTVRSWIMCAFFEATVNNDPETALVWLNSALEVLVWGRERYSGVSSEEKGAIFQHTFIRGVKCLRLNEFMTSLEDLLASADEILAELGDVPTELESDSIGFFHAFVRYPAGQAHTIRAFYYRHKGLLLCGTRGPTTDEARELFRKSGLEYMEAVKYYPADDEHCSSHWEAGAPLKYLLLLLDQMEKSIPLMKKIWEFSADAQSGRDKILQRALDQRRAWLTDIQNGRLSEDDIVKK
ncbi:hypothetical protein C8Q74DRAFT_1371747 [Fomes fomentarius]|nr:hypothetical protein C8Q74DRAFT_1371747 [Fomes fomentarius]